VAERGGVETAAFLAGEHKREGRGFATFMPGPVVPYGVKGKSKNNRRKENARVLSAPR